MTERWLPPHAAYKRLDYPQAHCDNRILHRPGECEYCDLYPEAQAKREKEWIAFTGETPKDEWLPCPADYMRGDSHTKWGGNVAKPKLFPDLFLVTIEGKTGWTTSRYLAKVARIYINGEKVYQDEEITAKEWQDLKDKEPKPTPVPITRWERLKILWEEFLDIVSLEE